MTTTPTRLYHGTSVPSAIKALEEGLLPHGITGNSLWDHSSTSHEEAVYLTDTMPVYFAGHAIQKLPKDAEDRRCAILEIDVSLLDPFNLVPDEDVLEQAGRGRDEVSHWDMVARTHWYRDQLHTHQGATTWKTSLEAMGTCAIFDGVPAEAITRVALLDLDAMGMMQTFFTDISGHIAAFPVTGGQQKDQLHWLMEGEFPEVLSPISQIVLAHNRDYWQHRSWVEVLSAEEARLKWMGEATMPVTPPHL
jgi:hypothetical protein